MTRLLLVFAVGMSLALAGCSKGPALGEVKGTVKLNGQPHANALVAFTPEAGGGVATGMTDSSGKYQLIFQDRHGAVVGKHKVSISTVPQAAASFNAPSDSPEYAKATEMNPDEYAKANATDPIPEQYNVKTTLTADVKAGHNDINFDLTTDGGSAEVPAEVPPEEPAPEAKSES